MEEKPLKEQSKAPLEHGEEQRRGASASEENPLAMLTANPTKADYWCLGLMLVAGVYGLAIMPLRAWMLAELSRLPWLVALTGSGTGTAALGSAIKVGENLPVLWPIVLGALMLIKFNFVYCWAGKLWGRKIINMWASSSKRSARNYARAERVVDKVGPFGFFLAYLPIPLPIGLVVFTVAGIRGMKLWWFMVLNYISALLWRGAYFWFGYAVGEPAVDLLKQYAEISNYVVIAIVVFVIWSARKNPAGGMKTTGAQ
ncbi:DedA family protein [Corynebacterium gerontici]|uniref:SNARE associated Golgi protein n=1 Tax=Corynebacterium gerontici TaxID=2079234 RepID=A0A3G6J127_9CORY|nr:DedA family protein [Corynebacterium gerontici]AZA11662.1 hypothetical protein CGERO_06810 [Corynebacterium gerontici]